MLPRRSLFLALVFLVLCGCGEVSPGAGKGPSSEPAPPHPGEEPTTSTAVLKFEGIDVSHFQNIIDWPAVRSAGKHFAFIKVTEGVDLLDPQFSANWPGAKAAGLVRGAYHFYVPEDDPITQAEFFITNLELTAGDLAPALDVEYSKEVNAETLAANIKIWLETVESAFGITPIVYTDVNFANQFLSSGFGRYPLWIASFEEAAPTVEGSWVAWDFWQYSETGAVDGIDGEADLDIFQGTAAQWEGLLVTPSSGQ